MGIDDETFAAINVVAEEFPHASIASITAAHEEFARDIRGIHVFESRTVAMACRAGATAQQVREEPVPAPRNAAAQSDARDAVEVVEGNSRAGRCRGRAHSPKILQMSTSTDDIFEVRLHTSADYDDRSDFVALREWLSAEPELRGTITRSGRTPHPGEMGPVSDVLVVSLGGGGAVTVLLGSITTWLKARRSEFSVEVTGPDGSTIKVNAKGPAATKVVDAMDPKA